VSSEESSPTMCRSVAVLALLNALSAHGHEVVEVHGAGTTNPSKLFWETMDLISERARFGAHMTYRAVGSSTGQKEFTGKEPQYTALNDFGAGDIPMTKSRYDVVVAAGRTMLHVPFALGGIAVFHSIPSAMLGGSELDLDACLLAKIFSGQITDWSDSEIRANNPGLTASGKIKVVRRKNGSSSTTGFTEYLNKKCPASWAVSNGCGSTGCATGSTIIWPTDFAIAEGSSGMSAYLQANDFAIGYIDAGHGHDAGLSEVALLNRDGKYLTTRQADIGAAAVQALAPPSVLPENATADFSAVNLYDLPGVDTWPITMISYFYLNQDMTQMEPMDAALLLYFVEFILSAEGQELAAANLFNKLPAKMLQYNTRALATLRLPAGTVKFDEEIATLAWGGASEHVISKKRRSYAEVERSRTAAAVAALMTPTAGPLPTVSDTSDDDKVNAAIALGTAGLAVGLVGALLAVAAYLKASRSSKPRSAEIPVRALEIPSSTSASSTTAAKADNI